MSQVAGGDILAAVCQLIQSIRPDQRLPITPQLRLLSQLDLDSLETIALLEAIQRKWGVDLVAEPDLYSILQTPEELARAIVLRCK